MAESPEPPADKRRSSAQHLPFVAALLGVGAVVLWAAGVFGVARAAAAGFGVVDRLLVPSMWAQEGTDGVALAPESQWTFLVVRLTVPSRYLKPTAKEELDLELVRRNKDAGIPEIPAAKYSIDPARFQALFRSDTASMDEMNGAFFAELEKYAKRNLDRKYTTEQLAEVDALGRRALFQEGPMWSFQQKSAIELVLAFAAPADCTHWPLGIRMPNGEVLEVPNRPLDAALFTWASCETPTILLVKDLGDGGGP